MPKSAEKRLLHCFGTAEVSEKVKRLTLGPLAIELRGGNLGSIHYDGIEVLRGVSYLVRDENWGTAVAKVSNLKIQKLKSGPKISYEAKAKSGDSTLFMSANIELANGSLTFSVTAKPDKDFKTNRTGFVILHPIAGVAGRPLTVTHTDGSTTRSKFPKLISPGQPFFNIRALTHILAPGLKAEVRMEGHKFEMEDQRNWGDASFKTYVCSLLDPWPYLLKAGAAFEQRVTLTITGERKKPKPHSKSTDGFLRPLQIQLPQFGLAVSAQDAVETLRHVEKLDALRPAFLTCLWDQRATVKTAATYAAIARATKLPVSLEIVVPVKAPVDEEVADIKEVFLHEGLEADAVILTQSHDLKSFQPTDERPWGPSFADMAAAARRHFPDAKIGGGVLSYFTELNRKPVPQGLFDFITHSLCPIVHDASDNAVMQTIETLPHIFASTRKMIGASPYHLGPTTIAARMNPYGADVVANPRNRRVCLAENDPRQFGDFAVIWNLALVTEAARAKLSHVTLSALCGQRGLLDPKGRETPLFRLFAYLFPQGGKKTYCLRNGSQVSLVLPDERQTTYHANLTALSFRRVQGIQNRSGRGKKLGVTK